MQDSARILYEDTPLHEECSSRYSSGLVVDPGIPNRSKSPVNSASPPQPMLR